MSEISSSINDSLPNLWIASEIHCYNTNPGSIIYTTNFITRCLLFLPVCIYILYVGLQRWWQQHLTSISATKSPSDIFTYHLMVMELFSMLGNIVFFSALFQDHLSVALFGFCLWSFGWYGERFFHLVTCVEHYLAVIHPITYLSLRKERGVRMRNIITGVVWLLTTAETSLLSVDLVTFVVDLSLSVVSFIAVCFCNFSVLCALIRPGPGEHGSDRGRFHHSKKRAFYTITAILGVLLLRCVWNLCMCFTFMMKTGRHCVTMVLGVWIHFPSSLLLPLLFLYRSGTLSCHMNNTDTD